jgi:fatty acid-binding protein 2, intestinal
MSQINGTWELESSENFDKFLEELGVGMIKRKAVSTLSPTITMRNEGKKWTCNFKAGPMSREMTFTEGEEFEEELISGEKVKTKVVSETPDKLITTAKFGKDKDLRVVREVVNGHFIMVIVYFIFINSY